MANLLHIIYGRVGTGLAGRALDTAGDVGAAVAGEITEPATLQSAAAALYSGPVVAVLATPSEWAARRALSRMARQAGISRPLPLCFHGPAAGQAAGV